MHSTLKPDDIRSTSMGCAGDDILLSPLAATVVPYAIECKNVERLNVWDALAQCEGHAAKGAAPLGSSSARVPMVVFRRNRSPTYAIVPWQHMLELMTLRAKLLHESAQPPRLTDTINSVSSPMHIDNAPQSQPGQRDVDGQLSACVSDLHTIAHRLNCIRDAV